MDCRNFQNSLFAAGEGTLDPDTLKAMSVHAQGCESCSRLFSRFMAIEHAIESEKAVEPGPFVNTRIIQRLQDETEPHGRISWPVLRPVLITIFMLAALMTGYLVGNHGTSLKSKVQEESNQIEVLRSDFYVQDFADEDITLLTID